MKLFDFSIIIKVFKIVFKRFKLAIYALLAFYFGKSFGGGILIFFRKKYEAFLKSILLKITPSLVKSIVNDKEFVKKLRKGIIDSLNEVNIETKVTKKFLIED